MLYRITLIHRLTLIIIVCLIINFSAAQEQTSFKSLRHNTKYFILDIDVDGDKRLDKVVSSKQYEGNDLYFFVNNGSTFLFAFKGINFSEDGGQIIKNIHQETTNNETLSILTYFPDRGHFTAQHYISYSQGEWILTRSIYEVINWQRDPSKIISCEVKQNIKLYDLTDGGIGWEHFKQLPNEKDRDKVCRIKNTPK